MKEILSLGAGVQSTTILLMSCYGELPKVDCAIFADTGWEPKAVYEHLAWLETEAAKYGIPIHRVSKGNIKEDALRSTVRGAKTETGRWASLPYYVLGHDGKKGIIRRQCTNEYKIQPIERFLRREILGLNPRQHAPKHPVIRQWIGISLDEHKRMRSSRDKWRVNYYPLVKMRKTRQWCIEWLNKRGVNAPRSACIGCPFRRNHEWRELRDSNATEFVEACEFDNAIRNTGGSRGEVFIHDQRIPLEEVNLDKDSDQLTLWDDECTGMCGV